MFLSASSSRLMYSSSWACVSRNTFQFRWWTAFEMACQMFKNQTRLMTSWGLNSWHWFLLAVKLYVMSKWIRSKECRPVAFQSPPCVSVVPPAASRRTPAVAFLRASASPDCEPPVQTPPGQFTAQKKLSWLFHIDTRIKDSGAADVLHYWGEMICHQTYRIKACCWICYSSYHCY